MAFKPVLRKVGSESLKASIAYVVTAAFTIIGSALVQRQASLLTSATTIWSTFTAHAVPSGCSWLYWSLGFSAGCAFIEVTKNRCCMSCGNRKALFGAKAAWEPNQSCRSWQ